MLCVTIAPESRVLAKADIANATRLADMVELRLDRFANRPDVGALIAGAKKPVLISCPPSDEPPPWLAGEEERIAILTEAQAAGPAYLELEPKLATQIPRSGKVQRIVSVRSGSSSAETISGLLDLASNAGADIIKLNWPAQSTGDCEPVIRLLREHRDPQIIGVAEGAAARMWSVLAGKLGLPWVYAALETGMEAFPGQPTIRELRDAYHIGEIGPETELVGVVGFGRLRTRAVSLLNASFADRAQSFRCLPLESGPADTLERFLEPLGIRVVCSFQTFGSYLRPLAQHVEKAVETGHNVDLLLRKSDGWHAYNMRWRESLKVLGRSVKRLIRGGRGLAQLNVLVLGAGPMARSMLHGLNQNHITPAVASPWDDRDEVLFCGECGNSVDAGVNPVHQIAEEFDCRYVMTDELPSVAPDVLIMCDSALRLGYGERDLDPRFLRPPTLVMDLTQSLHHGEVGEEAARRGCQTVKPAYVFAEQIAATFQAITGNDLPPDIFVAATDLAE